MHCLTSWDPQFPQRHKQAPNKSPSSPSLKAPQGRQKVCELVSVTLRTDT